MLISLVAHNTLWLQEQVAATFVPHRAARIGRMPAPPKHYTDGCASDVELLVDVVTPGQRVAEVPSLTRHTDESSSISSGGPCRPPPYPVLRRGAGPCPRRSPVIADRWPTAPTRPPGRGTLACVLCGGKAQVLAFPTTGCGYPPLQDVGCTTDGLSAHDDIVQCRDRGLLQGRRPLDAEEMLTDDADVVDSPPRREPSRREASAGRRRPTTPFGGAAAGDPADDGLFLSPTHGAPTQAAMGWGVLGAKGARSEAADG